MGRKNARNRSHDARRRRVAAAALTDPRPGWTDCVLAAALAAAVFAAYYPAWRGGFLFDDDLVCPPDLRAWGGLWRIWFVPGASAQYYPVCFSLFWIEHKLWGDAMLGYHAVSLGLHAASAVLVALIVRQLKLPGAWLAAAIFALHPVQVESVAWIVEQKNTLSTVFYLAAALCWLHFDKRRKQNWYLAALGLFVLALLSKTVTMTLPAALLVVAWWRRGQLSWRRDALPLAPFFALGAAIAPVTAWVEFFPGAQAPQYSAAIMERSFDLSPLGQCLVAGRVAWFYLGKLLWPADLHLFYPRWQIHSDGFWQYGFTAAGLLALAGVWRLRRRWRGPLAAAVLFVGTLFPVLGFFKVYYFIHSYVADHFAYVSSLAIIVPVSAAAAWRIARAEGWRRIALQAACGGLVAALAVLTWQQSRRYADPEALYLASLERNPDCWVARNNLGAAWAERGQFDAAILQFAEVIRLNPDHAGAYNNYGLALTSQGEYDRAIWFYKKALELIPRSDKFHNNYGLVLAKQGRLDEAIRHYREALKLNPDFALAHDNLGLALLDKGRFAEALDEFRKAVEANPESEPARRRLAEALARHGNGLGESTRP